MGQLTWKEVIILGLVPLGQLWARVFNFNGSLDKWYFLIPIFLFPPLSFIPLIMMKYGMIEDGKGSTPVDKIMLLPIIAKLIIPFVLPFIIDEDSETIYSIVNFVLQLLLIIVANLTRRYNTCNSITVNSIGKATIDSTVAYGIGNLIAFIIPWLPFIGLIFSLLEMIPFVGDSVNNILWGLGFASTYVIINMVNQDSIDKFCSTPFFGNIQDQIPFVISIIIIVITEIVNNLL